MVVFVKLPKPLPEVRADVVEALLAVLTVWGLAVAGGEADGVPRLTSLLQVNREELLDLVAIGIPKLMEGIPMFLQNRYASQ